MLIAFVYSLQGMLAHQGETYDLVTEKASWSEGEWTKEPDAVVFQHRGLWLIKLTWLGGGSVYWLVRPVPMKWGKKTKTGYGYVWKGGFCETTSLPPLTNPRTKKTWKLLMREPFISVPVKGGKPRARQEALMIQACVALGEALQ